MSAPARFSISYASGAYKVSIPNYAGGEVVRAEVADALVKALEKVAEGDVPRPLGKRYRADDTPSKHDQCSHGLWMYEDCGNCISEFARAALSALNTSGADQPGTAAIVPNQQDDGSKG